jgi:type II secretory pathway pseudopilin PulG
MRRNEHKARSLRREDGFTLPEFLTAATLLIGLLAVMGATITVIARTQPRIAERSAQIQAGRAMIERVTRELREGTAADLQAASSNGLSFLTYVRTPQCGSSQPPTSEATPSIRCRVTYSCTGGICTRTEAPPDGTNPGVPTRLVDGLNTSGVFGYWPSSASPAQVTVTLEYPARGGGESVTLSDGVALRN